MSSARHLSFRETRRHHTFLFLLRGSTFLFASPDDLSSSGADPHSVDVHACSQSNALYPRLRQHLHLHCQPFPSPSPSLPGNPSCRAHPTVSQLLPSSRPPIFSFLIFIAIAIFHRAARLFIGIGILGLSCAFSRPLAPSYSSRDDPPSYFRSTFLLARPTIPCRYLA
ncbi:hypothetical protein FB451DRAFT_1401919 [Mycena latifolia]|nr:hypothetical protein FB451DRAFT_1401919 [Mycena latifolia]